jgi:transcriptional regulator with XRE-family HTH domain
MKSIVNSIDEHVGRRLQVRRLSRQMSVERLAEIVGVSPTKLAKYEAGTARIGASELLRIAGALDLSVEYFFADARAVAVGAAGQFAMPELVVPDDAIELLRAFANVRAPSARRMIINLTISLATFDHSSLEAEKP